MKGSFLALLLLVVSSLAAGEADQHSSQECNDESAVKLSQLFGLRYNLLRKQENLPTLTGAVREAETVLRGRENLLNITLEGTEQLEMAIENMSTPELDELVLSQTCDENIPRDCCQIKRMSPSAKSGLYAIRDPCLSGDKLFSSARLTVYCDMETDGGGWIVIQRRNASTGWVNFARGIADYEKGFGVIDDEFWIGLKNIHELTNQQNMALKIRVWNDTENSITWNYPFFQISDRSEGYKISTGVGRGSGDGSYTAFGNEGSYSIRYNYYLYFTTYNYRHGNNNCGFSRQSGWWVYASDCNYANLNGRHQPSGIPGTDPVRERLVWRASSSGYSIYTHSEMKIRPQSCPLS